MSVQEHFQTKSLGNFQFIAFAYGFIGEPT